MKPWYRNSTLQMDDAEMEWLQSKDSASCAVWEWLKGDCQKRGTNAIRTLSEMELEMVSKRLGIDSPRFSQVSQRLQQLGWIASGTIKNWNTWQDSRTTEEDALRKKVEYWKAKVEALTTKEQEVSQESPKTSQTSPSEERRGDKSTEVHPPLPPNGDGDGFSEIETVTKRAALSPFTASLITRLQVWFKRRPTTPLSEKEFKALREIEKLRTPEEDITILEKYYLAPSVGENDYRRRDLLTLLNNWNGEIDRAKGWNAGNKTPVVAAQNGQMSGVDKMIRKSELDQIEERLRQLRSSYEAHQTWSTPDRDEFKRLKPRRDELRKMLGILV